MNMVIEQLDGRNRQGGGLVTTSTTGTVISGSYGVPLVPRRGRVEIYKEIQLPPVSWLVDGLIKRGGHHCLYGATGSMKSFLTLDLACRMANGMDFHGRASKQCDVLYVVGEGLDETMERLNDWLAYHRKSEGATIQPRALQIHDQQDMDNLIETLREVPGIEMVVFDTLSNCSTGVKLNEPDDVTARLNPSFTRLNQEASVATLALHHTNKDSPKERGAQAIRDHTDKMFHLTKTKDHVRLEEVKSRRGKLMNDLYFEPTDFGRTAVLLPVVAQTKEKELRRDGTRAKAARKQEVKSSVKDLVARAFEAAEGRALTTSEVVASVGRSKSAVNAAIASLLEAGTIDKVGHGQYRLAT